MLPIVFPGGSVVKDPPANAAHAGSIPWWGRSPEKEMGTHSSTLAWKIPWTEEPGGLQSTGPQRLGHDIATKHQRQFFLEVWFVLHLPQGLQGLMGVNERKLLVSLATPGGPRPGGERPSIC